MSKANNFQEFISLLKKAEDELIKKKFNTDIRLSLLRGVYYGTNWSKDFSAEGSQLRNFGFIIYTGFNSPQDIRPMIGQALFDDLQNSQDLYSSDKKNNIDIGHAFIGLDCRNSISARNILIPGQGGTGLEISTWLGDLGGGAANLAWQRSKSNANVSVSYIFTSNSDYGASINLEGDIGGFLIGSSTNQIAAPNLSNNTITDLFKNYLPISNKPSTLWIDRAKLFLNFYGANIVGNRIMNKADIVSKFAVKIAAFAVPYIVQRYVMPNPQINSKIAKISCTHLVGVSNEIATVFVNSLETSLRNPTTKIIGTTPWPIISQKGSCTSTILNNLDSKSSDEIVDIVKKIDFKAVGELWDKLSK